MERQTRSEQEGTMHSRLLIALVLAFALAACGCTDGTDTDTETDGCSDAGECQDEIWFWSLWARAADDVFAGGASSGCPLWHFDGVLWCATNIEFDYDEDVDRAVLDIWGHGDGAVFAVTWDKVLAYDGTAWSEMDTGGVALDCGPHRITGTDAGDLWVGTTGLFVYHYDGAAWEVMNLDPSVWSESDGSAKVWASGPDDVYVYGYGVQGFAHFDGVSWSKIDTAFTPSEITGTGPDGVVAIDGGESTDPGVWRFDGTSWEGLAGAEVFGSTFSPRKVVVNGADDIVVGGWRWGESQAWAVWSYDGAAWTQTADAEVPWYESAESWIASAIDYADGTSWFAGEHGTIWSYDGAAWTESQCGQ
jgi:hypothetical protein